MREPNNLCKLAIYYSKVVRIGEKLIHCHANGEVVDVWKSC